ncbi:MAG: hypothetical protein HYX35_06105 [Proteobacteria bacterium]|nr:hypothetical protein [Pseudomonadota bacterium]
MKKILSLFGFFWLTISTESQAVCATGSYWCGYCSQCLDNDVPCPTSPPCPQPTEMLLTETSKTVYDIKERSLFYCLHNQPITQIPAGTPNLPPTGVWYSCGSITSYPSAPTQQDLTPSTQTGYALSPGAIFACPGTSLPVESNIPTWFNCAIVEPAENEKHLPGGKTKSLSN